MNWKSVATIFLVIMFLYSGINKTRSLGKKEMTKLTGLGIPSKAAQTLNFGAGVLEIVASVIVILAAFNVGIGLKYRNTALVSLIAFTVLVTLLFKIWPKPAKLLGMTANLAVVGGLILALE
jgi:uncharacterized membrane protein YphA (DoxX/SURF4 family)